MCLMLFYVYSMWVLTKKNFLNGMTLRILRSPMYRPLVTLASSILKMDEVTCGEETLFRVSSVFVLGRAETLVLIDRSWERELWGTEDY